MRIPIDRNSMEDVFALMNGIGVYAFRASSGAILYVGKSKDLKSRFLRHLSWVEPYIESGDITAVDIIHCKEEELDDIEKRAIGHHSPALNTIYNRSHKEGFEKLDFRIPSFLALKVRQVKAKYDVTQEEFAAQAFERHLSWVESNQNTDLVSA